MKQITEDEERLWREILQYQIGEHYLREILKIQDDKKPEKILPKLKDTKGEAA